MTSTDALLAKVTGALLAYGSHTGAKANPADTAQKIITMIQQPGTIDIPCRMHRGTSHPLTLREAAVVIVTLFGMAEDDATHPGSYDADQGQCVREILYTGKHPEGYAEHVESLLGEDAFDYPDTGSSR